MLVFSVKPWSELAAPELYEILALRQRVFVVEQRCAYLDCDGKDLLATHLMGRRDGELVAYARLLPKGAVFDEPSIGRVATAPEARGHAFGRALMHEAIAQTWQRFGGPIFIGAQQYLERFYRELGFTPVGPPYDEDGIPHIHMRLSARNG
jgi:ElaA protein